MWLEKVNNATKAVERATENETSTSSTSSKMNTTWAAPVRDSQGEIGSLNDAPQSQSIIEKVENKTAVVEKPISIMSYEERKEARSIYILLIEELRNDICRLQKERQSLLRCERAD